MGIKTIIVDDERWNIMLLKDELAAFPQIEILEAFQDPREALAYTQENPVEFALLDIEMPYMNGLELGRRLRKLYPKMVLIYVTGYDQYIKEAILQLKADFYILKPYNHEDIEDVVRRAEGLLAEQERAVEIRTFGGFDVRINGEIVLFTNRKAKELLALCVYMEGRQVSLEKAVDTLWEDRPYDSRVKSLYRKAVIYLNSIFRERGCDNIFENGRGYCCIHKENVRCDYFDYIEGRLELDLENENNTYLPEYEWAEGRFFGEQKI